MMLLCMFVLIINFNLFIIAGERSGSCICSSQDESIRKIAGGILLGAQFQYFMPKVAKPTPLATHTTEDVQRSSLPPPEVHLEEIHLTYPLDGVGPTRVLDHHNINHLPSSIIIYDRLFLS